LVGDAREQANDDPHKCPSSTRTQFLMGDVVENVKLLI
jgi:hypothetical protein